MRFDERRDARAFAALCLGIALFTGGACAPQQAGAFETAASEAAPAGAAEIGKKPIAIWKQITVGTHKSVNAVRQALDAARMGIGDSADEILGRPAFAFSQTKASLDLVLVTVTDLGFPAGSTPVREIYGRARQLGLELCPAEAAPYLRLHYVNQPVGEFLRIAMQPVATYRGDLVDLTVANGGAGLLLVGGAASPDLKLHSTAKFVFVRPPEVASGEVEDRAAYD